MIWLYGAGGIGIVALDILTSQKESVGGFLDNSSTSSNLCGFEIKKVESLNEIAETDRFSICIGDVDARSRLCQEFSGKLIKIIHESALVSTRSELAEGVLCFHQSIVQTRAKIGIGAILNTGASIDHDCEVGDYSHIGPNATICGYVKIGERSYIGANATVLPGITIGNGSVVGAGAVVTKDVQSNSTVVGVPAKAI